MDESVLGGFLFALRSNNSGLVSASLERIAEDPQICHLLLSLTSRTNPEKNDLDRLVIQLKAGTSKIEDFIILQYGSALSHLNTEVVTNFLDDLLALSCDGCPTIFEIAYMYTLNDETKKQKCIPFLKKMLIEKNCFFNISKNARYNDHILYSMNETIISLLQQREPDQHFAAQITEEIIRLCREASGSFAISHEYHDLVSALLSQKYIETTWPLFGHAIISNDYRIPMCLKDILGCQFSREKMKACFLDNIPLSFISNWCKENPEKAPYFLAEAIHPLVITGEQIKWSQLAEFLLDTYGNDENVLNGLINKMHNFSWEGSTIPHYEMWVKGFTSLLSHNNPNVKKWAEKNIDYAERTIQETKSREDEDDLRFR
jgi:hypothetical protein